MGMLQVCPYGFTSGFVAIAYDRPRLTSVIMSEFPPWKTENVLYELLQCVQKQPLSCQLCCTKKVTLIELSRKD